MEPKRVFTCNLKWMYQPTLISLVVLLFTLSNIVHGGKILIYPMDGSHWVNMRVIIEELHSKGHDITVVRASNSWYIKENSPHYTTITIPNTGGFDENFFGEFILSKHLKIQREKLIQSLQDAKFDLVLTDPGIGGGTILARVLHLPLVYNVRWTIQGEAHLVIAPSPLSYVPYTATELTDKMTFLQRVTNVLAYILGSYTMTSITEPNYKPIVQRYFGPDVDYNAFFQEADIWLMRSDFVFEFPKPTIVSPPSLFHRTWRSLFRVPARMGLS
uniref:Uncharacterized protein n=1 Tax=Oncorhynchus kisutch TaxID=8019 RepID=A0A8C7D7M7_ONCKI